MMESLSLYTDCCSPACGRNTREARDDRAVCHCCGTTLIETRGRSDLSAEAVLLLLVLQVQKGLALLVGESRL